MDPEEAWALPQPPGCVTHTVPTTGTPHLPAAAAQVGLQPPSPPLRTAANSCGCVSSCQACERGC